jgi:hypothetical protein
MSPAATYEPGSHLVAFFFVLFVGQPHVVEDDGLPIGIVQGIAADEVVNGEVGLGHYYLLSLELVSKFHLMPVSCVAVRLKMFTY